MFEKNIQESIKISEYINKHLNNTLSAEEKVALDSWISASSKNRALFNKLQNSEYRSSVLRQFSDYDTVLAYEKVLGLIKNKPSKSFFTINRLWWAAAGVAIFITIGGFFYKHHLIDNTDKVLVNIIPAKTHARLSGADGKNIDLDTIKNGSSIALGSFLVKKNRDGVLQVIESKQAKNTQLNTITSPKGAKYDFILADGTHVWLNAESSIRFPANFSKDKRSVETTGEVYFEVSHVTNARKELIPFVVRSAQQTVTVLGTHFNVSAYPGESIRTTLLEGKVQVTTAVSNNILEPGTMLVNTKNAISKESANLEAVMAWKEGTFYFEQERLDHIMNQLARWYNVDVAYDYEDLKNQRFSGTVSREGSVMNLLKIMEETDVVHFKIQGRRIVVTR